MNKRPLLAILLSSLIVSGLIAGLFIGEIQKALTVADAAGPTIGPTTGPTKTTKTAKNANTLTGTTGSTARTPGQAQGQTPAATNGMAANTTNTNGTTPTTMNMPVQTGTTPQNVLAQDSFQRKDQTLWGAASDGRQWGGDANAKAAFTIAGGTGQIANGQGSFNALLGTASANSEVVASAMINQFTEGANIGVVLRWNDDNNWYKVLIDGKHISLLKRANGISTTLSTLPFQAQGGVVYTLRFQAVGAMLFAKAWPLNTTEPANWIITSNDTALTSGQSGIRVVLQDGGIINITSFLATPATLNNPATT